MKIKLCGMVRDCDITYANEACPDYVGFVFAESKRKIDAQTAERFRKMLRQEIQAVGVFVNEKPEVIVRLAKQGIIQLIQLHGTEDEVYIRRLRELLDTAKAESRKAEDRKADDIKIIKAVRVREPEDISRADRLSVDYLLLDAYVAGEAGGSGKCFAWDMIKKMRKMKKPYFLAGGIGLINIEEALLYQPYGIDTSSGIETDGKKDREKMRRIVERVQQFSGASFNK